MTFDLDFFASVWVMTLPGLKIKVETLSVGPLSSTEDSFFATATEFEHEMYSVVNLYYKKQDRSGRTVKKIDITGGTSKDGKIVD